MLSLLLFHGIALATDIEITSNDCNFEVRKDRDATVLGVNKLIAVENSISRWEIELPKSKIKLPLEEGLKVKFNDESSEEVVITYKNGILTHVHKATTNFTRDTLELGISADLKHIRSAKFTRKLTGLMVLFGSEKFDCKF
jgi:hypothetical protein